MNLPNQTLVLVADGRKMLFLRNHGEGAQIDLRLEVHREQENGANRDQASDAPGRSFPSRNTYRSSIHVPSMAKMPAKPRQQSSA